MTSLPAVEAALQSLFPAGVAVAAEQVGTSGASTLWPEEREAIAGAVPQRVAEFAAGRTAAHKVLTALGQSPAPLPMGPDRAAIWPAGLSGSIAHDRGLAIAVARRGAPLGVDLEPDAPLDEDLWHIICTRTELDRLDRDIGRRVRHVFCAKEAVFKAQLPDARAMFGFEVLEVTLAEGRFDAQFRASVGAFQTGQVLSGRLAVVDNVILAGVAW